MLEIEDLIGGARFSVLERRNTAGIAAGRRVRGAGDLGRRARRSSGGRFSFIRPTRATSSLEWVERVVGEGMPRDEILFHLSRQYVRWHRLGHIGAAKVYRDGLSGRAGPGPRRWARWLRWSSRCCGGLLVAAANVYLIARSRAP